MAKDKNDAVKVNAVIANPVPGSALAAPGRAMILLAAVTVACLVPFAARAFNIDEPLFLWSARQIQSHPLDPYGFAVNWYGVFMPMSEVTKNPPLVCYLLAGAAKAVGWSEPALHLVFLLPAVAAVLGTYVLARRLCPSPLTAALAGLLTPVFLLSSATVMCDTTMVALWVWAVILWVRGIDTGRWWPLAASAILVAACALAKYFGMGLIPLLLAYGLARKRRPGWWTLYLLIPVIVLACYQQATAVLYSRGLLSDAASYATLYHSQGAGTKLITALIGLAFTGGCLIPVLFYSPLLWSRKQWLLGLAGAAILTWLVVPRILKMPYAPMNGGDLIQFGLMAIAGLGLLILVAQDLYRTRSADSLLLALWIGATFVFAAFINWTVNGRSVLPMVPAMGIVLVRRLDARGWLRSGRLSLATLWPLAPAAFVALVVTGADYRFAGSARQAAVEISRAYGQGPATVWFQGHWGFQYYMQECGHKPLDVRESQVRMQDIIINPQINTNIVPLSPDHVEVWQRMDVPVWTWLTTMNDRTGAGFYCSIWGPVPFLVGKVAPEAYNVCRVK